MAKALCRRCKGSAEGSTFEEASSKINHAVGLGRNIPCGASYGCVIDVSPEPTKITPIPESKKTTKTRDKPPKVTTLKDDIKKDIKEGIKDVVENVLEDVEKQKSQSVNE